jgi:hypothetical protein
MFYRLTRTLKYLKFNHQTRRILDTPRIRCGSGPATIVSMVAGYDVQIYLLTVKALFRRLPGANIVAIIASDVSARQRDLIREHLGAVEFVQNESLDSGKCQHRGTWERLVYIADRSASEYIIQMDCDILCLGPIPEVTECIAQNRAFALGEGIPKKPLCEYVKDGYARGDDNIVISFEKRAKEFHDSDKRLYLRASSGFAGFAKGVINRSFIEDFHEEGRERFGARWLEWGTEQIASNFAVANSPDSFALPRPRYLNYDGGLITPESTLVHFLGYCRFKRGYFPYYANREVDAQLEKA